MYSIKIVFVLTLIVLTNANPLSEGAEETDDVLFLELIECARLALITGIPEIDLPSYNPFISEHFFSYEFPYPSSNFYIFFSLDNLVLTNVPMWEVHQLDLISSSDDGVDIFNYTIHWHQVAFTVDLKINFTDGQYKFADARTINMEFDHSTFTGILDFTKPVDGRNANINDLSLTISTEAILVDSILNEALTDAIKNPTTYTDFVYYVKDTLMNFIQNSEKIDAIISHCQN